MKLFIGFILFSISLSAQVKQPTQGPVAPPKCSEPDPKTHMTDCEVKEVNDNLNNLYKTKQQLENIQSTYNNQQKIYQSNIELYAGRLQTGPLSNMNAHVNEQYESPSTAYPAGRWVPRTKK